MNEQIKYDVIKKLVETNGNKKRYIQDMSHPWKKDNFMKYVYAMVGHETRTGVRTNKSLPPVKRVVRSGL